MPLSRDDARRKTAGVRRERIIAALTRAFDLTTPSSAASRLISLLDGAPRPLIVSGDINGIVSATMLARAPEWRAVALVWGSEVIFLRPDIAATSFDLSTLFGVDVFGSCFPSVSNHPVLRGPKRIAALPTTGAAALEHDRVIKERADELLFINPSLWSGVQGHTRRLVSVRRRRATGIPSAAPTSFSRCSRSASDHRGCSTRVHVLARRAPRR
jgi:hypothetical protein